MLADAPYETTEPVMHPLVGLVAGLAAGGAMLGTSALAHKLTPMALAFGLGDATRGLVAWLALAAFLGLMYGISQLQARPRDLIGVGIFYGIFLWIAPAVFGRLFFGQSTAMLRTFPWFVSCLAFGLTLGILAVLAERTRSTSTAVVARD